MAGIVLESGVVAVDQLISLPNTDIRHEWIKIVHVEMC